MASSEEGEPLDNPVNMSDDDQSPRVLKQALGNNILLCGFTSQPIQNRALFKLLQDLSTYFFVCCQPSPPDPFSLQRMRKNMMRTDVCVFYMYEGSLNDKRCLSCVQSAWELMVPLVILRHPRMKLVMTPISRATGPHAHNQPDYHLLQDIFSEGYRQSLPYNHLQHGAGMRILTKRLAQLMRNETKFDHGASPAPAYSLKIPPLATKSYSYSSSYKKRNKRVEEDDRRRSNSVNDSSGNYKQRRPSSARGRRRKLKRDMDNTDKDDDSSSPSNRMVSLLSSSDEDPMKAMSMTSLDEPKIYHTTQYIIFPAKVTADKSLRPTLVLFPTDVMNAGSIVNDSVWQSDASDTEDVEEKVKEVTQLQGGFDLPNSPTRLAPYEKPLE